VEENSTAEKGDFGKVIRLSYSARRTGLNSTYFNDKLNLNDRKVENLHKSLPE